MYLYTCEMVYLFSVLCLLQATCFAAVGSPSPRASIIRCMCPVVADIDETIYACAEYKCVFRFLPAYESVVSFHTHTHTHRTAPPKAMRVHFLIVICCGDCLECARSGQSLYITSRTMCTHQLRYLIQWAVRDVGHYADLFTNYVCTFSIYVLQHICILSLLVSVSNMWRATRRYCGSIMPSLCCVTQAKVIIKKHGVVWGWVWRSYLTRSKLLRI